MTSYLSIILFLAIFNETSLTANLDRIVCKDNVEVLKGSSKIVF
jgi:hypothetical protein